MPCCCLPPALQRQMVNHWLRIIMQIEGMLIAQDFTDPQFDPKIKWKLWKRFNSLLKSVLPDDLSSKAKQTLIQWDREHKGPHDKTLRVALATMDNNQCRNSGVFVRKETHRGAMSCERLRAADERLYALIKRILKCISLAVKLCVCQWEVSTAVTMKSGSDSSFLSAGF